MGLYVFANGACYLGQYNKGKREGDGLMIMPDEGLYKGQFVNDNFEGQVSSTQEGFINKLAASHN